MREQRSGTSDDPLPEAAGAVETFARRLPVDGPSAAVAVIVVGAYLVITSGLVVIGRLVASGPHGGWDDVGANRWLAGQRTAVLNDVTAVGSRLAETMTVIAIAVVVVAILAFRHRFLAAGFIAIGLVLEVSVFLTTTLLVDRSRPAVPKLDAAPPTSSFPSGHTAAALVLYGGIAIVLMTSMKRRSAKVITAIVLFAVPVIVGMSRLSRGMHHPTDVFAGALLGIICLAVAGFALRVAAYDIEHQRDPEVDGPIGGRAPESVGAMR